MRHAARAIAILLLVGHGSVGRATEPLADFVAAGREAARWETRSDSRRGDVRVTEIELESQTWKGRPWRHQIHLLRPEASTRGDVAILSVEGGGGGIRPWDAEIRLAQETGVAVAVLDGIPNQPLFGGLYEDDLIAHTFVQYLRSGDADWPLLFPMTRAVVRAMDAIQAVSREGGASGVRRFIVTGASKRGWTTWLAAASDERVAGIAPLVFDNLNFAPQMKHQLETWGRYSPQLGDYSERSLPAMIGTDGGRRLVSMVDPYAHRAQLERPVKLIVNGTNDPYWALDAIRFYWPALRGPKAVLYVPNAGHEAGSDPRAARATAALARRDADRRTLPGLSMADSRSNASFEVRVSADEEPAAVTLWQATARSDDFRDARWSSTGARRQGSAWTASIESPAGVWTAVFAEAEFREAATTFPLSTPVELIPAGAP
jgi:PhoPQ-activated pathogenicity-related protein